MAFDTRINIEILFGKPEVVVYEDMPEYLQQKYRLYITRRKNFLQLYKNLFEPFDDCLCPTDWLDEYDRKKSFIYIAEQLNLTRDEVKESYYSALDKMRKYMINKGIKVEDYVD